MKDLALESRSRRVNDITLHVMEGGEGSPVVFLHGFPEFWYTWRNQVDAVIGAGFRFVAPDLRGYNLSDKPTGVTDYAIDTVAGDIVDLIRQLGGRVALVGHDWGGVVAWRVARMAPELLSSLAILNIPHPRAIRAHARKPAQAIRFWYQLALQPPVIAEWALRARRFLVLRNLLKRSVRVELSERDVALYVEAWSQPGALTGMLNYYRAIVRRPRDGSSDAIPRAPHPSTMLIIGENEPVFLRKTLEASRDFVPGLRVELIAAAGHFVHQDQPDKVNALLIDFLRQP